MTWHDLTYAQEEEDEDEDEEEDDEEDDEDDEEDDDDRRAEYLGYDDHPPSYFSLSRWHSHVMTSI